ncbi:MAG: poly-beta-1,6 N-acetyl-D-glucosamine export porin PgaA [Nitrospiraceae bacterium]|nr:MAG: poly-beta-1,6 N-acetyl-D-glucosamine export porin PgaA [Nitrospiraceae bacterium]
MYVFMKSALIVTIACCTLMYHVTAADSEELQDRRVDSPVEKIGDEKTVSTGISLSVDNDAVKARQMIEAGRYAEAIPLLEPYTSEPLRYRNEVSDYIVLLTWQEQFHEAITAYEALPESFPRQSYLLRNAAKSYYELGRYVAALSIYKEALQQLPTDEEAQRGVIYSLAKMGQYEEATNYILQFQERVPDSLSLAVTKANLYLLQGRYQDALNTFQILIKRKESESEAIYESQNSLIASLPAERREKMLEALQLSIEESDESASVNYILVLIINRDFKEALKAFEKSEKKADLYPDYILSWIAWAYFKVGEREQAKTFYEIIRARRPDYPRAELGIAYCLAQEGKYEEAMDIIDRAEMREPRSPEALFARAYVYEQSRRFWKAIQEYDRILTINRDNAVAGKLRSRAFSDLGLSTQALKETEGEEIPDFELVDSIIGDMAVDRIHWKEYERALVVLEPEIWERGNLRRRYDYMIALAENGDMREVIAEYEKLLQENMELPPWILENAASAYLYMEQPKKAIQIFDDVLSDYPQSFNSRIGKFYALQELRQWEEGRNVIGELDRDTPESLNRGKREIPNWLKMDTTLARGWFLIYEDKLQDAEDYFLDLHERAPANIGIRNGLAHTYMWRGWPRKALREFRIINTLDSKYSKARIGQISAMNMLHSKEEARAEARTLYKLQPKNKHLQQLMRQLAVEEMRELYGSFSIAADDDNVEEIAAEVSLTQPLALYTDVYAFLYWARTSDNDLKSMFRRTGIGVSHALNSSWRIRQQLSVSYNDGEDLGSFTEIAFTPDDYWTLNVSFDSFTTDVPMRARAFGIESNKLDAGITYRESEWRSYSLGYSRMKFSDSNERDSVWLGFEQGLLVKNDWKMRIFLDLYASDNSRTDVPYFSPDSDYGLSVTHLTEHTIKRIYRKAFIHRLYLTAGMYKQDGFSSAATGSVRYEHDYQLSDTQFLLWGITLGRNSYDGETVSGQSYYLTLRWLF